MTSNSRWSLSLRARVLRFAREYGRAFSLRDVKEGWHAALAVEATTATAPSDATLRSAFAVLTRRGQLRRVARGVYDVPQPGILIAYKPPRVDDVARAVARKFDQKIDASGAVAANNLDLSLQVPATVQFWTDKRARLVQVGATCVQMLQAPRYIRRFVGTFAGRILSALHFLGAQPLHLSDAQRLRQQLKAADRKDLRRAKETAPQWMQASLQMLL